MHRYDGGIAEEMFHVDFVFVCPQTHKTFNCDDFQIINNKGVTLDASGNKVLDATLALNRPCPFCGLKHSYAASELSCPFGG